MKVLCTGSRTYQSDDIVNQGLNAIYRYCHGNMQIISGEARGADTLCQQWAQRNNVESHVFFAKWSIYGRKAGFLRNKEMVESQPDICCAFYHGSTPSAGTKLTIDLCHQYGIPVIHMHQKYAITE